MASKELTVFLNSNLSTTEAVKDKLIAASGSSKKAAEVIRDTNGKVILVVIKLPESASEAATTALLATPGVSNVVVGDLVSGTTGIDGSELTYTNLLASGWTLLSQSPTMQISFGDVMTFTGDSANPQWFIQGDGFLPYGPLPSSIEWKGQILTAPAAGFVSIAAELHNGIGNGGFYIFRDGTDYKIYANDGRGYTLLGLLSNPTAVHTWNMSIASNGEVTYKVDGVTLEVAPQDTNNAGLNRAVFLVNLGAASGTSQYALDYYRYTTV
jgi:hypothetical protein